MRKQAVVNKQTRLDEQEPASRYLSCGLYAFPTPYSRTLEHRLIPANPGRVESGAHVCLPMRRASGVSAEKDLVAAEVTTAAVGTSQGTVLGQLGTEEGKTAPHAT